MHNLVRIGKFFLIFFVMIIIIDIVTLGYTYIVSVNAMEDTLSSIALMVAEENCLDFGSDAGNSITSPGDISKLNSAKQLMAGNATAWLCYNNVGFYNPKSDEMYRWGRTSRSANHTDIKTSDCSDITVAMSNIDVENCLVLSTSPGEPIETGLYSYITCPQRGSPITITLKANVNIHLLSIIPTFGNVSIPIKREITVVGMKFYKGKDAA